MLVHAGTHVLSCVKVLKFSTRSGYMYCLIPGTTSQGCDPDLYAGTTVHRTSTRRTRIRIPMISASSKVPACMHACMQATRKNGNLWKILRLAEKFQARELRNIREHSRTFENIREHFPGEKNSRRENFSALER